MTDKTKNLGADSAKAGRRISRAGRAAMAYAGAANLAQWRERADKRANELEAEVATFRAQLLADCGPNPTATRVGLVEGAVTTFAALLKVRRAVIRSPKAEVANLVERANWLASNLSRSLKHLNLDARPRPRTLADVFPAKVEPTAPNHPMKPPEVAGK